MQHDVQHAKSSPSIKRDIYNCENRFSETENLLLNNNAIVKITGTFTTDESGVRALNNLNPNLNIAKTVGFIAYDTDYAYNTNYRVYTYKNYLFVRMTNDQGDALASRQFSYTAFYYKN